MPKNTKAKEEILDPIEVPVVYEEVIEEAIKEPKVIPLIPDFIKAPANEIPVEEPKATLNLNSVNNFLNIIDIIMISDVRGASLKDHFVAMLEAENTHLKRR